MISHVTTSLRTKSPWTKHQHRNKVIFMKQDRLNLAKDRLQDQPPIIC